PRPAQLSSRSRMSTTVPGGKRVAGFSTIFWKIHGWDERRTIFKRTCGRAEGMESSDISTGLDSPPVGGVLGIDPYPLDSFFGLVRHFGRAGIEGKLLGDLGGRGGLVQLGTAVLDLQKQSAFRARRRSPPFHAIGPDRF